MDLRVFVLQISFIVIFAEMTAFGFISQDDKKCKYLKMDRMLKIKCFDMNLKEVPQYLSTSVEVLDLSYNRIKKLKRNSFQRYTRVRYLLLYENMIQSVEPDTFSPLSSVQEIDLSNNALLSIPLDIFQLPSLRNLYVDSNDLIYLQSDLEKVTKPIRAPLEYINVADCGLQDLPNMGIVPYLWHINASSNPLKSLTTEVFASMCHLRSIDLTKTQLPKCACHQVVEYVNLSKIKNTFLPQCPKTADSDLKECPPLYNITVGLPEFEQCNQETIKAAVKNTWLMILSCAGGIILVFLLLFCCIYKRKRRKSKKKENQKGHFMNPTRTATPQDELLCDTTYQNTLEN